VRASRANFASGIFEDCSLRAAHQGSVGLVRVNNRLMIKAVMAKSGTAEHDYMPYSRIAGSGSYAIGIDGDVARRMLAFEARQRSSTRRR
jgi:hypothetical protein